MNEQEQATAFLDQLFGEKPEKAAIQMWMRTGDKNVTHMVDKIPEAAALAVGKTHDVYVGCGLAPRAQEHPVRTRLKASEVVGIPGVWADIDVNGGPEGKEKAAPTRDAALELAASLLEPTVLVNSGYGIQAWWCFEGGPWIFETRAERDQAARIVAGFQGALRAAARRAGWGLDATQDLARVMRVPGGSNWKSGKPVPVELLELTGNQYRIEELGELGQGFEVVRNAEDNQVEISVDPRTAKPAFQVAELLEDVEFRKRWDKRTGASGGQRSKWSDSEFEMSICDRLVKAGLNDQEIADTLTYWRLKYDPLDSKNKVRADRIAKTIKNVRATVSMEVEKEVEAAMQEQAVASMEAIKKGYEEPIEAKVLALFNQMIGGPEIARLKQHSRDPQFARFSIELADGREINLGEFGTLLDERSFRKVYAVATGHLPKSVGPKKWEAIVAGLLKVAVVSEDKESTSENVTVVQAVDYYNAAGSNDRDGACAAGDPFIHDGFLHVHAERMLIWLHRARGQRITKPDLIQNLHMAGFERKVISYVRFDGTGSSRSYFRKWWEAVEGVA